MDIRNYFSKSRDINPSKHEIKKAQEKPESPQSIVIRKPRKRPSNKILSSDDSEHSRTIPNIIDTPVQSKVTRRRTKKPTELKKSEEPSQSTNTDSKTVPPPASKRQNFRMVMEREPPTQLGSKVLPEASENCLEGLTFVLSGVFESFTREDMEMSIRRYGGRITAAVSRKTDYLLCGRDCGQSKLTRAKECATTKIDEDEYIAILKCKPPKTKTVDETSPLREQALVRRDGKATVCHDLLVDKYRPRTLSDIIGQQGANSAANKLLRWLTNWRSSLEGTAGVEGGNFRAALLSGPPGVGKTTTAQVACKEAGMSYIEMNASDCRSKKRIEGLLRLFLSSQSIVDSFSGKAVDKCLIMDEVDGMAGNEDRGGISELIACIKTTCNPIICICNNRSDQKMRSLRNHCFDLIFPHPRVEHIKAGVSRILTNEAIRVPSLDPLIESSNRDIRQIINTISLWSCQSGMTWDQLLAKSKAGGKDIQIQVFEACRRAFSLNFILGKSMNDRLANFFVDYSLMPLFMFENYLGLTVQKGGNLGQFAAAADAFCVADTLDAQIRGPNPSWELLPHMGFWSTVVPPLEVRGSLSSRLDFPSWFGRYSTRNKNRRLLEELYAHSKTRVQNESVNVMLMYRLTCLKNIIACKLTNNSKNEGIRKVGDLLNYYYLQKEDMETIFALCDFGKSSLSNIPSNVKSALTRLRKKDNVRMPYSLVNSLRAKRRKRPVGSDDESEVSSESSFDVVPLIKTKDQRCGCPF